MILGVDSSIVIGVLKGEEAHRSWFDYLLGLRRNAQLIVCEVVYAELAGLYRDEASLQEELGALGLSFDAIRSDTAFLAGQIHKSYRQAGGTRATLIPDFLIGAHAINQCSGLLTSDRGYLRTYFKNLKIFQPAESK